MKKLLLLVFFSVVAASPLFGAKRPNVILIVTDDQGYGDMSCHGNPWLKTPHLDRLHDEGVSLNDYHVDPYCTPTRAALMTGRYSTRVGTWSVTEGRQLLGPDEVTMANVFEDSGYKTGMFGKWHIGDPYPYAPRFRGFQDVVKHMAGGVDEIGNPVGNDYFDDRYYRNGVEEQFEGYCTNVFFGEAMRFIREVESDGNDDPFFIYLPTNAMHGPFTVAEKYSDRFKKLGIEKQRSIFYGMVENFDENLGRLLGTLEELAIDEETIVIFMGDNGTAAGSTGKLNDGGYNSGMKGKKGSLYDGGHRVASFIRWPGKLKGGRKVEELTMHCDWMPTLIDLCNLKKPKGVAFDGRSIETLLEGKSKGWSDRSIVASRQADQLKIWTEKSKERYPQFTVMTERWRLTNGELYDIVADPSQENDLAAQQPERVQSLYETYRHWFEDVTQHKGAYTLFEVGNAAENPTRFTTRDWHPTDGGVIWKMSLVRDDSVFVNGFWPLDVKQSGSYKVRLSRYPDDELKPMGANRVRMEIGHQTMVRDLKASDNSVSFTVELTEGEVNLQTWLMDAKTRKERGAYYVEITQL